MRVRTRPEQSLTLLGVGRRAIPAVLALVALVFLSIPAPLGARSSLEYELLSLVNGGRSRSLPMHSGLQIAGRGHSREMADEGHLDHSGVEQRIGNAAPDPYEANGAPDDGYKGAFCENTAYVGGDSNIAERVYEGWRNSASHLRCMTRRDTTAAGVGMYFDGSYWWATLELMEDKTPPGSPAAASTGAPPPATPTPVVVVPELITTGEPPPTTEPEVEPAVAALTTPEPPPRATPGAPAETVGPTQASEALEPEHVADRSQLGWPEILATIGITVVSIFAYRRTGLWSGKLNG